MKTRHLFATAALASLFAACSQEELIPSAGTSSVANRPVVGVVDIVSSNDVVTRYNVENCTPEAEDAIGLYLMDEFSGYNNNNSVGELNNANWTRFEYQSNWWTMYTMVNYIQSNYGYEYMPEDNKWINRASQLVEGNYIVMFPKNDEATNRRDLWYPIKPIVELKHHTTNTDKYYVGRDNQFMLDYQQVQRVQEADKKGNLTLSVKLKPILTYAKFVLENQARNRFVAQKLVFKAPGGKALPTVAYVKPCEMEGSGKNGVMTWLHNALENQKNTNKQELKDNCGNVIATGLYENGMFTQKAARDMVWYETTEERVPYGLDETESAVAYEYTFVFPDEGEGGVRLEGGNSNDPDGADRVLTVSLALPAFDLGENYAWNDMEVVVYGKMWDPTIKGYRPGIIRKLENVDNAEFTLDNLKLWESGQNIPVSTVRFDDQYFYQQEEIRVETTEDLLTLIDARLSSSTTSNDIDFVVYPYGKGLEITKEVIAALDGYQSKNGVEVSMKFKNDLAQGTPVILEDENIINRFSYEGGVNLIINKKQTTRGSVNGVGNVTNNSELTIKHGFNVANIKNTDKIGVINIERATVTVSVEIDNDYKLNLKNATINGTVNNHCEMTVAQGSNNVNGHINNDNGCVNCGKDAAVLQVNGGAKVSITSIYNADRIINNGTLTVTGFLTNYGTVETKEASITKLTNEGTLKVTGDEVTLKGENINKNSITVAAGAELTVEAPNVLNNVKTITVEGDLMDNIKNSGLIEIKNLGHAIVNGVYDANTAGVIDVTDASDAATGHLVRDRVTGETGNYFKYVVQAVDGKISGSIVTGVLSKLISVDNWKKNRTIIEFDDRSPETFIGTMGDNIERVVIKRNLIFSGTVAFTTLNASCNAYGYQANDNNQKMVEIKKGCTVTVDNGYMWRMLGEGYDATTGTVTVDGYLKFNNTSTTNTKENIKVFGKGRVEFGHDGFTNWDMSSFDGDWMSE